MRAVFFVSCAVACAALACARERGADAPTEITLAAPSASAPTIRPPEKSDYLELPPAAPVASAAPRADEDDIPVEECRALLRVLERCIPADTYRDIVRNLKTSTREPSLRGTMADMCKRMIDAYAQTPGACAP